MSPIERHKSRLVTPTVSKPLQCGNVSVTFGVLRVGKDTIGYGDIEHLSFHWRRNALWWFVYDVTLNLVIAGRVHKLDLGARRVSLNHAYLLYSCYLYIGERSLSSRMARCRKLLLDAGAWSLDGVSFYLDGSMIRNGSRRVRSHVRFQRTAYELHIIPKAAREDPWVVSTLEDADVLNEFLRSYYHVGWEDKWISPVE